MDDNHEGEVDLGLAQRAGLGARFGVQLAPCGECAVLCAAGLGMGRVSRRLRWVFDSPWHYFTRSRRLDDRGSSLRECANRLRFAATPELLLALFAIHYDVLQ